MSPEGVTGEVASANAWPRSPTAAYRSAFGSASAAGGSTSVFGDIGIPSAPTAVVSSNFPGMPSAENDVDVTVPVCWASRRNVAVAESPATIVSMLTVSFERSTAPLMERGSRLRLTKFAGVWEVLVTMTLKSYSSPAVTVAGWDSVSANVGLRTSTTPLALPLILTGPIGSPSRVPEILIWTWCVPSRRPSTRNSALPLWPGATKRRSSAVPSLPSGPGWATDWILGWGAGGVPTTAMRRGSSLVSGTVSLPAGSTISALMSRTTRLDWPGATLETISSTLKNWLR